ncbi:hypothetical protein DSO57_1003628 [Entomophthora muscae]|uniref:Uncharacterized protein n=1 Tax=Entomophthora muscae TaxID=34485 RepID=A0ACC2SL27_9FUNG|nr:hypothetical protein DSO57_1003628 [Entomophthora muscae]
MQQGYGSKQPVPSSKTVELYCIETGEDSAGSLYDKTPAVQAKQELATWALQQSKPYYLFALCQGNANLPKR